MGRRIGSQERPLRVAIIGAGPSGFYAAGALLKQEEVEVSVDLYDRLPTPFGLVRDGVAPDHQKIKAVSRIYHRTALDSRVRFFGNVCFGQDIQREELLDYYDQVIYAVGTPSDRRLGIPGEDLTGSHAATEFVGWYNGHPDYTGSDFELDAESVAVVGNGNVAMDVTRILARPVEELQETDIADHALARLRASRVRNIYVLGRRGPVQAAFTNPELRELGELEGVEVVVSPEDLELDPHSRAAMEADREAQKNYETLRQFAEQGPQDRPRKIHMRFLVSPAEILGEDGRVSGLRLQHNELQPTDTDYLRAASTDRYEEIPIGLIFRAIGYKGIQLAGLPYEPRKGIVPNRQGRIYDPAAGKLLEGEYVVGWVKRGPTGVIGTNKPDAVETVKMMMEDVPALTPVDDEKADPAAVEAFIRERQPRFVSYEDWCLIDEMEVERGKRCGRPRVKFYSIAEMLTALEEMKKHPQTG